MRKNLALVLLSCLLSGAAPRAARADEGDGSVRVSKDLSFSVGYKMWLNTWETVINSYPPQEGAHLNAILKGPVVGSIPNVSIRYKRVILSGSYLFTGDYVYPSYKDVCINCGSGSTGLVEYPTQWTATRWEEDANLGFLVSPNIILSAGFKGVTQRYKYVQNTFHSSAQYTKYRGGTLGIAGSAAIGHGFSLYGNGVGGLMTVTYQPDGGLPHDTATYEASEVGIAWRAPIGLSLSLGYKFQYLTTHIKSDANFRDQAASDVSRGYILGLNYTF